MTKQITELENLYYLVDIQFFIIFNFICFHLKMGVEFGINMFSFGDIALHRYIKSVLPLCYNLLGRNYYADILKEHLKIRKQMSEQ
jgi:hypothetical protein